MIEALRRDSEQLKQRASEYCYGNEVEVEGQGCGRWGDQQFSYYLSANTPRGYAQKKELDPPRELELGVLDQTEIPVVLQRGSG